MNTKAFLSYLYEQEKISQDTFFQCGSVVSLPELRTLLESSGYSLSEWQKDWNDFQKKSRSKTEYFVADTFPSLKEKLKEALPDETPVELVINSKDTVAIPKPSENISNMLSWENFQLDSTPTVGFDKKLNAIQQKFQGQEMAFLRFLIEKGRLSTGELEIYLQQMVLQSPEDLLKSRGMSDSEFEQFYLEFQQNLRKDTVASSLIIEEVPTTEEISNEATVSQTSSQITFSQELDITESSINSAPRQPNLAQTRTMDTFAQTRTQEENSDTVVSELKGKPFPSSAHLEPTLSIGKYEILEKLAQGGMGVVYKVRHVELNQIYALKVILPNHEMSSDAISRFQREAKVSAKLHHPYIVRILDFGKENDQYYFCMEYVEGRTLKEFIQEKVGIREFLFFFKKVLEGLHYAHLQGIVHRDIKPSNIFVTPTNDPKIVDFGVAKDLNYQVTHQLTYTGQLLGTPLYMAPEQASEKSNQVTPVADIYSIGVCLYNALTKRHPFEAETLHKLLFKVISEEAPAPSHFNPELHRDLDVIILKSLHKSPKKRYPSAKEFADDIGRFLDGYPIHARPITFAERAWMWVKRNRQPLIAGIVVLIVALLLFFSKQWEASRKLQKQYREILHSAQIQIEQAKKIHGADSKNITLQIRFLLNALSSFNLALSLKPEDAYSELQKYTIGQELILLACKNAQYDLADYLVREIERLKSIPTEQKEPLYQKAEEARKSQLKQHLEKLYFWKEELKKLKKRIGLRERALLEISKMPEEEIFLELITLLKEGIHYFTSEKTKKSSIMDEYYEIFALALGQLENPKAEEPLADALKQMLHYVLKKEEQEYSSLNEVNFMVALAQALEYSKAPNAANILQENRLASGDGSLFWNKTHLIYQNLIKIENLSPKTAVEFFERALFKHDSEDLAGAIKDYTEALQLDPTMLTAYNYRGDAKRYSEDIEGALADFNEAIRIAPEDEEAYIHRANLRADFQNDRAGAIADYSQAIQLNPDKATAYCERGYLYAEEEKFEEAFKDYNKALEIDPQYALAYSRRGYLWAEKEKYRRAAIDYTMVIRFDPHDSEAYRNRGWVREKLEDIEGAFQDYTEAIRLDPENTENYFERAVLKFFQNDFSGAIQDFNQSLELDVEYMNAYFYRGKTFHALAQHEEAKKDFKHYLELNKNEPDADFEDFSAEIFSFYPELK